MNKFIGFVVSLFLFGSVHAQTAVPPATSVDTVTTFTHSLHGAKTSLVLSQRIGVAHDLFGIKGTYVDLRTYGGFSLSDSNAPTAGLIGAGYFALAREITLGAGPVFYWTQHQNPRLALYLGLKWNFPSH